MTDDERDKLLEKIHRKVYALWFVYGLGPPLFFVMLIVGAVLKSLFGDTQ